MTYFQDAMDDLNEGLMNAETEKNRWQPVGDILIENLQKEIDKTKVCRTLSCLLQELSFFDSLNFCFIKWFKVMTLLLNQCLHIWRTDAHLHTNKVF